MGALLVVSAFALVESDFAIGQDPPPGQPVPPRSLRVQPSRPVRMPATPAAIDRLQEEVEVLAAQHETRVAYVKAAAVELEGAKLKMTRMSAQREQGTVPASELDRAKLAIAAAEAQVQVRQCEVREIEVKLKYARKRLEAATRDPAPLPPGQPPRARPGTTDNSKEKIAELEADVARAEAEATAAKAELDRIRRIAQLGRVRAGTIEEAEAKAAAAQANLERAKAALVEAKAASK